MDKEKFIERILTKKYVEEIPLDKFDQIKTDFNLKRKKESEEFKDYGVIIEEKQTKLYFIHDSKAFGLGLPILNQNSEDKEKTDLVEKELFWEVFGRYSASFPIIRLIILILLSISAFLFSIVLVQNIISGLRYLIL
ncbi:MAG: hypothetical protein HOO91_10750 [Bacteroidales bacterium]|nr:hypothetical protein [Bacteroidales bacterium]